MSTWNWPHQGCVGLWRLNDNVTDDSGNGINGSGYVEYSLGRNSKCLYLHDSYYSSLGYPAVLKVSDLTISMWYKGADAGSRVVLYATSGVYIGGSASGYYGHAIGVHGGKLGIYLKDTSYTGNIAINDNKWHFIMASRDDSYLRLYVDGRIDAAWSSPATITYCNHAPASYYWAGSFIGAAYRVMTAPSTPGLSPTCRIDDLMVEDYAITPQEALNRYLFLMGLLN